MQALVDCIVFLELSNDEVVDPDSALQVLENIAYLLQRLNAPDRDAFLRFVEEMANDAARIDPSSEVVARLRSMPEYLGLVEEE
jgi:hypothetical protein